MLYLGIDQHRKQLTVNLRNEEGEVVLKRQVSTQWDRVRKFFEELEQQAELEGGFKGSLNRNPEIRLRWSGSRTRLAKTVVRPYNGGRITEMCGGRRRPGNLPIHHLAE